MNPLCLFQMPSWCAFFLLWCIMSCVESAPSSPFVQKNKYKNSFRLTRSTRTRVQNLLKKYKEQQMGNVHFEDRSHRLRDLPLLSTDFSNWLQLSDWDRLDGAFRDIQSYWSMLERKRKQLEKEQNTQRTAASLLQSIKHIQLDLRDLMSQVSSQMRVVRSSWVRPTPAATLQNRQRSSRTVWECTVEGYIILRDLNLYLTKLARDFLLLASKTHL
ncbi:uncharacterized protein LOC114153333 isoform X1 [Xiphophorus couchianus]|nr:uncharacterized protein LOC114153333 isoform X1 [Xiphophorus couchianus]